jgi:pimeloyl-ACP methyl ester carboxylesterase
MTTRKPRRVRWLRRIGILAASLTGLCLLVYIAGERYKQRDFLPDFAARTSPLAEVTETLVEEHDEHRILRLKLVNERGIWVEAHLKIPAVGGPRHPVLITMGGAGTGRKPIDLLKNTGDWFILALDYPYHGDTGNMSDWEFLQIVPEARRALMETVPGSRMALDYLWRREDVDRDRVVLAGGSLGALFAPALAATEPRVSAVAIVFGAGDLQSVIRANLDLPWPARPVVAWVGSVIVSPLEPLKYVHRIAPRPVFMLSGTEDDQMPLRASRLLHERAGEPKTIQWLPVGHVNIRDPEFHGRVLQTCMDWLAEIGFMTEGESMTVATGADPETDG